MQNFQYGCYDCGAFLGSAPFLKLNCFWDDKKKQIKQISLNLQTQQQRQFIWRNSIMNPVYDYIYLYCEKCSNIHKKSKTKEITKHLQQSIIKEKQQKQKLQQTIKQQQSFISRHEDTIRDLKKLNSQLNQTIGQKDRKLFYNQKTIAELNQSNSKLRQIINQQNQKQTNDQKIIADLNRSNLQLNNLLNQKDEILKELKEFRDQALKFKNVKKQIDGELNVNFERFHVSHYAIKILFEQGITTMKDLSELQKQDFKQLGIKFKDILAILRIFK